MIANKIIKSISIILVFVYLLSPLQVSAAGSGEFPIVYQDEGSFVRVPAAAGDIVGGIAGGAAGVAIGLPVGILLAPVQKESVVYAPLFSCYFLCMVGRVAGGTLTGAPFLAGRKIIRKVSYLLASWEYRLRNPY